MAALGGLISAVGSARLRPLFGSGEIGEVLVRFREDLGHGAYRSGRRALPYALV